MRRRTALRVFRFGLLLFVAATAGYFVRSYEWFRIPEADSSLEPAYARGSSVLVHLIDAGEPLERGAYVVYAMARDGVEYARFGRVRALPGDVVGARDGKLTVNGEWIGPLPVRGEALGAVPPGHVLILANAPVAGTYVDSRALGFIPRARVQGIIVFGFGG